MTFVIRYAATAWESQLMNAGGSSPADGAFMCFTLGLGRSRRVQLCFGSYTDDPKIRTTFFGDASSHFHARHPERNLQLRSLLRRDSLCVRDAARKRYWLCGRETQYRASGFPTCLPGSRI